MLDIAVVTIREFLFIVMPLAVSVAIAGIIAAIAQFGFLFTLDAIQPKFSKLDPIKGTKNLQEQLFGLEANFEELSAIDFKKGCYVGQENTARMKLKNKIRKRLLPIKTDEKLKLGSELTHNNINIGKILINSPYPFALIKLYDPDFSSFQDKEILAENKKIKIINKF